MKAKQFESSCDKIYFMKLGFKVFLLKDEMHVIMYVIALNIHFCKNFINTPQPLYNTIAGVQANFHVSYPINVIMSVKCIDT